MKKFDLLEIIRKGTLEPIGNFFKLMNEHGKHIATFRFENELDALNQKEGTEILSNDKDSFSPRI